MTPHISRPECGTAIAGGSLRGWCLDCLALVAFTIEPAIERDLTIPPRRMRAGKLPSWLLVPGLSLTPSLRYFGD
jgi:hypothetical protein